ncbi:MAG: sugar phosphorylase [Trueperaceae bacterium]|nr:sugar phosphorylase [Trueperaceae bacterium]
MISTEHKQDLAESLEFIYPGQAEAILPDLLEILEAFRLGHPLPSIRPGDRLSEKDCLLITYGDQIQSKEQSHLQTLHQFLTTHVGDVITGVHFLPFFPYTSDDGFSVVDYYQIDPNLGSWSDVKAIGKDYRLMFDAVINHISARSGWFQGFLNDESPYTDFFITESPDTNLSMIVRPRTLPLLTPVETPSGRKHVWTTFSPDQIDLNMANPEVLLEVLKVLLFYAEQGASIIRLDAVTYLWKEVGHPSVHHPKTHRVLQLLRTAFESAAPNLVMLTETNVPHAENIGYFGDGHNEAQMVYNFALPPLVLHSFLTEDGSALQNWASDLNTPSAETCFFNFLASHDGIGLRPVESLLEPKDIEHLVASVLAHKGLVSYKTNSDGSQSPYELNISYFDALNDPESDEALELQIRRFLCAQSILLSLVGVPGIYVHSLLGSRNNYEGVKATGRNRSINREKFRLSELEAELSQAESRRARVLKAMKTMLNVRQKAKAFHPQAAQEVIKTQKEVFVLKRSSAQESFYCLHNFSHQTQQVDGLPTHLLDVFNDEMVTQLSLAPLAFRWLKVQGKA